MPFKCFLCKIVIQDDDVVIDKEHTRCPQCGTILIKMCGHDKITCSHPGEDMSGIIAYCPECGKPCCPICGCEDVLILSRITGYIQDVQGFNQAKAQELKDRTHYTVV